MVILCFCLFVGMVRTLLKIRKLNWKWGHKSSLHSVDSTQVKWYSSLFINMDDKECSLPPYQILIMRHVTRREGEGECARKMCKMIKILVTVQKTLWTAPQFSITTAWKHSGHHSSLHYIREGNTDWCLNIHLFHLTTAEEIETFMLSKGFKPSVPQTNISSTFMLSIFIWLGQDWVPWYLKL